MGLGKTIEAMCLFEKKCLVVAPTRVLPNWQAELGAFAFRCGSALYHGPTRKLDDAERYLTTYAILHSSAELSAAHFDRCARRG